MKGKVYSGSQVKENVLQGVRSLRELASVQSGCKEVSVGAQLTLPLHSVWTPRTWIGLWLSVDLIMLVSWVILDIVKLVISVDHHICCAILSESGKFSTCSE